MVEVFGDKRYRERHETRFYSLQNIKQGKADVFRGKYERS